MRQLSLLAMAALARALCWPALGAETPATVTADRVNVRGQAAMIGEVVTQLKKGETITVLDTITPSKPAKGDPAKWFKIALPANTMVWVNAPMVDAATKAVTARRLNLRAGPGENYSVIGRLDKGAVVKQVRVTNDWIQIEAPTNSFGFVASDFIALQKAAPVVTPVAVVPAPVEKPVQTQVVDEKPVAVAKPIEEPAKPPVVTAPPIVAVPAPEPPAPKPELAPPAKAPADEPLPKRIVAREGIFRRALNIQAPTYFSLESLDDHRMINYLDSSKFKDVKLDPLEGVKLWVSGEEVLDQRWPKTPVIVLDDFRLIP